MEAHHSKFHPGIANMHRVIGDTLMEKGQRHVAKDQTSPGGSNPEAKKVSAQGVGSNGQTGGKWSKGGGRAWGV